MQCKKKRRIPRAVKIILGVLLLLCALAFMLENNLENVILDMANARATATAVEFLNTAVSDIMRGGISYEDLITVRQDTAGRVTMLQANTVRMNDLAMNTALRAQEMLDGIDTQNVLIPLGAALGIPFLAAVGPYVKVKILPVGSVTASFLTEFESAGINQTRHKIYLAMHTNIRLVIPTGAKQVNVTTQILIAESIIVGGVPDSYIEVPSVDSTLNFAP